MKDDVEQIKLLMLQGFAQAFITQIGQLFKVYSANAMSVADQQDFTKKGIENAVAAYRLALTAIDNWDGD